MEAVIEIDGREVGFKATALTPRFYRHKIGRDMIADMNSLRRAYNKAASLPDDATEEERTDAQLKEVDLEIFENVSWIMAKQYEGDFSGSPDEWLDGFSVFSIYQIMPHILNLWNLNNATTSVPKKK